MENRDIKKILRYPLKDVVYNLIKNISLREEERKAIELVDIEYKTEDYAAKKICVSKRTIQNYRLKAYKKLNIAFSYSDEAQEILRRLD